MGCGAVFWGCILGLQPIPGDPKDNGVAAMLDDRTFCFVIQHGRHTIVFLDCKPRMHRIHLKGKETKFFRTLPYRLQEKAFTFLLKQNNKNAQVGHFAQVITETVIHRMY